MSEGPTTAGSIRGELKLDASDWMEKLAAADAAARKLGGVSPTVKVDVDDNGAITKLAAVDAAAKELGGSTDRLNASQKALNNTNGQGAGRWALIAGAIAALIPLFAPLLGYAVGVAGALSMMGAAGVLAIFGIISSMKDATVQGAEFRAGFQQVVDIFHQLSSTAASTMLSYFGLALESINRAMPFFNEQMRVFGTQLGSVLLSVLNGTITAMETLNPLFVVAGKYVESLASAFEAWTQSGALTQFLDYAEQQLPIVAQALGNILDLAIHLLVAFAPFGTVMLQAISALSGGIAGLPISTLQDLVAAGLAGYGAFKLWGAIAPILEGVAKAVGAVGIATQIAEGPIGWVTAGISALAAVLAVSVASASDASAAQNEYTDALRQSNGEIDKNIQLIAVKQLHDSGAIKAVHELGGSTKDLVDASLGNASAQKTLNDLMAKATAGTGAAGSATGNLSDKQGKLAVAAQTVGSALKDQNGKLAAAKIAHQEESQAVGDATGNLWLNFDAVTAMKDAEDKAATATDALAKQLAGLGQTNLSEADANIAYQQALADSTTALQKNGATTDVNTQKGRDNMSALDGLAQKAIALVAAHAKAGASTNDLTADMATARQSFIDTAMKMGMTADQANALATQYGLVPKNVQTAVTVTGVGVARTQAQQLKDDLAQLTRDWTATVHIVTQGTIPAGARAMGAVATGRTGGTIQGLASGGGGTITGAGNAFTDTAGLFRLANGEEVTSNMYGQASLWRPLLKDINSGADRLQIAATANRIAGVRGGGGGGGDVQVTIVNKTGMTLSDLFDIQIQRNTQRERLNLASQKQKGAF